MSIKITPNHQTPAGFVRPASRRQWLKGVGALLGTGLLAAPAAVLAAPATTPAATPLAGGTEPIGMVQLLAGTALPIGWSRCDGRVLSVAEHPVLFAVLGSAHGGDGIHTFALPCLRELVGAGPAAMQIAIKTTHGPVATTALAELRVVRRFPSRARIA